MPHGVVTFRSAPLDVLLTEVNREELVAKLRCRMKFASADLYYPISEEALDAMPQKYLVEQFARELTRQFAPALAKASGTRR